MTKRRLKRRRGIRYLAVGALNTAFGLGLFAVLDLTTARYVGHYVVLTIASVISILVSHTTQRKFVWESRDTYLHELARFSSVYLFGFLVNLALFYIAHSELGFPAIATQVTITALIIPATFVIHRFWTFARGRP